MSKNEADENLDSRGEVMSKGDMIMRKILNNVEISNKQLLMDGERNIGG